MRIRGRIGFHRWTPVLGLLLWGYASKAMAEGGKPATQLVNVADTRHMAPGIGRFIADVYNDDLLLFGLLVVGVMAGMGIILGFLFDRVIRLLGINLGKIEHRE